MLPLAIFITARDYIFAYFARRFERSQATTDGAFLAEILDKNTAAIYIGDQYWEHRSTPDLSYPEGNYYRNWNQGVVVDTNGAFRTNATACALPARFDIKHY